MTEYQKCRKCGYVFAQIDRSGPSIGGFGDIMRHGDETMCPHCGGSVIWVDSTDLPLSPYKRMEDAKRHMKLGCLYGIVALLGWLLFFLFIR